MKVVHIVESFGGGVYTYFKDLALFFSNVPEVETYIIYSNNRNEVTSQQILNDFPSNINMICLGMEKDLKPIKDIRASFKIAKTINQIKPDIIHLHSSKAGVIGRVAAFLNFKRKNIYYTPHGYSFLKLDISPLKRKIFYGIEKLSQLLLGGTTIACGDTEYAIAQRIGKSFLVRNGINIKNLLNHFNPTQTKGSNRLKIGTIGRIMPQKNPKLFNHIAELFPQYDFIWIGDGDQKNLLQANNIKITGWLHNSTDIFSYLNDIDLYIQTSLWEGLPIAILEAMAFHKPIIATNVIGNKDVVINGYNGFLFNEANDLKDILPLFENKNLIAELGNNAFNDCNSKYNWDKNFKVLLDIYKN